MSCKNDSSKTQNDLIGEWEVVNANFLPFEHISFCDILGIGSVFDFKKDEHLYVYQDKNVPTNCNKEQFYSLDSNYIRMQEWDMLFSYEILILNNDSLAFKIKRIPSYFYEDNHIDIKSEIDISDPNFYTTFKKEGIIVELKKVKP